MQQIVLPYQFSPREYQLPLLRALDNGVRRVVHVWHRRAGKDKVDFNYLVKEAARIPAQYYYFAPNYEQGRKIVWDNIDNNGFKMLDHIPPQVIKSINKTRMQVEFKNDSLLQVIGTDEPDRLVGTNPRICVFTEYSIQNPLVWDYVAPILVANDGTAIFNFTPRGKNHAYDLLQYAKSNPKWFTQILTVDDTHILSEESLASEKDRLYRKYGDDALFLQEYYCSFEAPVQGSYYGPWIQTAEKENRVTTVPYEPTLPVHTYWDLGVGDSTSIWFVQYAGKEIRMIDYYETNGEGLPHYVKKLQEKGYIYGSHHAPHDIRVRELGTGKSRYEVAQSLGITFRIVTNLAIEDGIDAARNLFPRIWFDKTKTDKGMNALKSYQKAYDDINQIYKDKPLHNWASHGADAFRYFAVAHYEDLDSGEIPDDTIRFELGAY